MILNILLLPVLFFIGLVTSYEDIKYGKIRNKWTRFGLIWGLSVIFFFFLWYLIASPVTRFFFFNILNRPEGSPVPVFTINPTFLLKMLLNSALSLLIAFFMWQRKAWAAGDAKLFFVFSLLLPISFYWKSYLTGFPSFALLVNIFIPIVLFLFFRSFWHIIKLTFSRFPNFNIRSFLKKAATKESRSAAVRLVLKMSIFLVIFVIFGILSQKFPNLKITSFQAFFFAGLIIFSRQIARFTDKKIVTKTMLLFLFSIIAYDIIAPPYPLLQIMFQSMKTMLVFMLFMKIFNSSIDIYVADETKKGRGAFPMAVWMFFGAILTLFLKESVLSIAISFFR